MNSTNIYIEKLKSKSEREKMPHHETHTWSMHFSVCYIFWVWIMKSKYQIFEERVALEAISAIWSISSALSMIWWCISFAKKWYTVKLTVLSKVSEIFVENSVILRPELSIDKHLDLFHENAWQYITKPAKYSIHFFCFGEIKYLYFKHWNISRDSVKKKFCISNSPESVKQLA